MTVKGLVLSIFPGIDILGKAFEEEGYCVVRGKTLRGCVLALGKHMGWGSTAATILESLRNMPASQNSELLVSILEEPDGSSSENPEVKKNKLPKLCSFDDCTLKEKCDHYKPGKSKKECHGYETECTTYPSPTGSITNWYHCKHLPEDMWPKIALEARQEAVNEVS